MRGTTCDLGVAARVVRGNKVLLVQEARGPHKGMWGFPKGQVDDNEHPEAAVLRELREETGFQGLIMGLAGLRTAKRRQTVAIFLVYDVHLSGGIQTPNSEEISKIGWFDMKALQTLPFISETMFQLSIEALAPAYPTISPTTPLSKSNQSYFVYSAQHSKLLRKEELA